MGEIGSSLSEISLKTNSNPTSESEDALGRNRLTVSPKTGVRLPCLISRTVNRLMGRITEKDNLSVPAHLTAREMVEYTSINDFTVATDYLLVMRRLSKRQQQALLSKLENSDKLITQLLTTKEYEYYGLKKLNLLWMSQAGPVLGRIVAKHLTEIETIIKTADFARADGMTAVSALVQYGDEPQRQAALTILSENLKLALATSDVGAYDSMIFLDTLLTYGNDEQISSAEILINKALDQQDSSSLTDTETSRKLIPWLSTRNRKATSQLDERKDKLTSNYLDRLGLDSKSMISFWTSGLNRKSLNYSYNIEKNLDRVNMLEYLHPGICGILNKQFGIVFFGRYSEDLLLDQFKNRYKKLPYGVIVNPYADWNGAFYLDIDLWDKLRANLARNGYLIRVAEVGSKLGLVRKINSLRHNYGSISFAILGGHGTSDWIKPGNSENSQDYLMRQDLRHKGASALFLAFSPDAPIVFNSCSTGVVKGIGQEVSRLYHTQTTAPNAKTSIKSIDVTFDQSGKLQFRVTYKKDNSSASYKTGTKVE